MGMRAMQQRVWQFRGEQYLLLKSPPASGKSRALMFVALDKLHRQNLKQAIVVVPEKSIGASFGNTALAKDGFFADWTVAPQWNLCNAPGTDGGKVDALGRFLTQCDEAAKSPSPPPLSPKRCEGSQSRMTESWSVHMRPFDLHLRSSVLRLLMIA